MPPVLKVNRHTHTDDDDESEPIDVDSADEHDHDHHHHHHHTHSAEESSNEEDDDDYSSDDQIVEEEQHEVAIGSPWDFPETDSSIIEPSDSASRSRHHPPIPRSASQRQYPPHSRPSGRRVQSTRDYTTVPEPPPVLPPQRRSKRPSRSRSVLEGPMEEDEYPYGGYGRHAPPPHHHAPPGWDPYGGARSTISGYDDPYLGHDPNSFMMLPEQQGGYRGGQRGNRMSMPARASSSGGHELMAVGHYGPQHYNPYGPPPGYPPYGHPGYGYYPPHHSQGPSPSPGHSKKGTPAPEESKAKSVDPSIKAIEALLLEQKKLMIDKEEADRKKALEAMAAEATSKLKAEEDKLAALQNLMMKHNAEQLEREKKNEAARKAEADAKAAAEARAVEEKKRADEKDKEIKHAAEKAKMEAEKEAQKKADEEKVKHEKEIEEVKKKAAEFEAAKKKFEEEAKALRPKDDMLKPPIKFKDAVGRKFNFPWHVCKTWKGMESLILQAFSHIDNLGQMVREGHYDLIGPDNEIILPQIWETMIKPDMAIQMQMWPVPEKKKPPIPQHPQFPPGMDFRDLIGHPIPKKKNSTKDKEGGKKVRTSMQMPPGMGMGMGMGGMGGMMPPPPPPLGHLLGGMPMPPPPPPGAMPIGVMEMQPKRKSSSKDKKKASSSSSKSMLGWFAGSAPAKKESSKKKK